uniref:GDP-mannose 4,6-dehydratase n=1 Tax=Sandarakinorhabdus sp. DWP1-3-1 TaxID=2804627 RepID=UPI003CE84F16
MPRALIVGVSGQDGAYLSQLLLDKGYEVWGTSRDAEGRRFANLQVLDVAKAVVKRSMNPLDLGSVIELFGDCRPDEIYNLGGQSSVGLSFAQPAETLSSIVLGTQNLLEAIRLTRPSARFYSAGSSESFGDTGGFPADETTPFRPRSPYGVAKASAFWQVAAWRQAYGLFSATGILFNHESPLRPARFVTSKIVHAAARIAAGSAERLVLGQTDIVRDWGYAPEYVEAMWAMLQQQEPEDFVIATGYPMSLDDFVATAFARFGLDHRDHIDSDPAFFRPNELGYSCGMAVLAEERLGWRARTRGPELITLLADAASSKLRTGESRVG